jgi:ABC-type cobalamin/Fe3+-siderophores transport system ATPase subunit
MFAAGETHHLAFRNHSSTVVVLVGPNNSGKSLALREIEEWCCGVEKTVL